MNDNARSLASGRQAALLLVASGALTILNNYLPGAELLNRGVLNAIGSAAVLLGIAAWVAPWERWHPRASLALAPAALTLIATANYLGGVSAYSYAVYFVVLFVWIGTAHAPLTSLAIAPLAAIAYVTPFLVDDRLDGRAVSVTVAIPVCVLVGETVARAMRRLRDAQQESERRAILLQTVADSARSMSVLDPRGVLEGVVSSALALGFDAAEICRFDHDGSYRVMHSRGLPDEYIRGRHPAGSGLAAMVRDRGDIVVIDDYASFDAGVPAIRSGGFRVVVGAPIWSGGVVAAALIAGTHARQGPPDYAEAFALLSAHAGRALENAERFSAERRAVQHLAHLDRLKDEFISTASHELRTPVTVVEGMGLTLAWKWDALDDRTRRELLERMNLNAHRLSRIVTSLLDFSRMESGAEADIQPVQLRPLIDECTTRLGAMLSGHGVQVRVRRDVMVRADPMLLDSVMENLLANAAKHTPAGTTVRIAAGTVNGAVVVTVADNGPGIAAEDLPRLGERFFRPASQSGYLAPGTGLGLAFVQGALKLHASKLQIECPPTGGAVFSFALAPASATPENERSAEGPSISRGTVPAPG
ncbi:MAG TPA: ATP-binding protein [Actinomycetota bacterium]|nr:ATP-binding protein [Actinomycetota bacterium]